MGKNSWTALLLALVVLVTTVPACASGTEGSQLYSQTQEDAYGGLAPPPRDDTPVPPNQSSAGDPYGGLAPPSGAGSASTKEEPQVPADRKKRDDRPDTVLAGVSLSVDRHTAYLYGSGGAFAAFHPTRQVTRAEAAQMLYRLLPEPVLSTAVYADVPGGAWYAEAIRAMADLGVMEADEGRLDPGREVSRGEFTRYVASFFPLRTDAELFSDVAEDDPNAPFIRSARAYGWAQGGDGGLFHPDETINRAAATVLLNRALGRTADRAYIDLYHPVFYVDVAPSSWYYYDVCEATVGHEHSSSGETELWTSHTARAEVPQDGLQLVDGWLYCYDSARGDVVRDGSVGSFTFNSAGHFTTGNNELDAWLHKIVMAHTEPSQTQEEMLRSLFLYTRDSFKYLRRPPYAFGAHDFMERDALRILNSGYGNCYCYASLFWYLSRWIGYDSVIYSGTVGQNRAPHSWVEINMDGRDYIFDTELEMAYRRKKRFDIDLYKFYDAKNSWNYVRPKS